MSSKNHWRREHHNNYLNWHECKAKLLKHYPENKVSNSESGFIVDETFVVSPHKKWRCVGKDKWYFYKNIDDLVTRYFKRENNNEDNQRV